MVETIKLNNNIDNNMNNTNLNESIGVINKKAKRYRAYDVVKGRNVSYTDPYGRTAKRLYTRRPTRAEPCSFLCNVWCTSGGS